MRTPNKRTPAGRPGFEKAQTNDGGLHGDYITGLQTLYGSRRAVQTSGRPIDDFLRRLEGVRKSGADSWIAKCPAHPDKHASLSIKECADGTILLHDFAGCDAATVVQAVGLQLSDLFPERIKPRTPEERRSAREAFKRSAWAAALGVLGREATVVEIAAHDLAEGKQLDVVDHDRLLVACGRIQGARQVLV